MGSWALGSVVCILLGMVPTRGGVTSEQGQGKTVIAVLAAEPLPTLGIALETDQLQTGGCWEAREQSPGLERSWLCLWPWITASVSPSVKLWWDQKLSSKSGNGDPSFTFYTCAFWLSPSATDVCSGCAWWVVCCSMWATACVLGHLAGTAHPLAIWLLAVC